MTRGGGRERGLRGGRGWGGAPGRGAAAWSPGDSREGRFLRACGERGKRVEGLGVADTAPGGLA